MLEVENKINAKQCIAYILHTCPQNTKNDLHPQKFRKCFAPFPLHDQRAPLWIVLASSNYPIYLLSISSNPKNDVLLNMRVLCPGQGLVNKTTDKGERGKIQ